MVNSLYILLGLTETPTFKSDNYRENELMFEDG